MDHGRQLGACTGSGVDCVSNTPVDELPTTPDGYEAFAKNSTQIFNLEVTRPAVQLALWLAELLEWRMAWRQCVRGGADKIEAYTTLIAFPERLDVMRRDLRELAMVWAAYEERGEDCSKVWADMVALSLQAKCIGDEMAQHQSSVDLEVLLEHLPSKVRRLKAQRETFAKDTTGTPARLRTLEFSLTNNQEMLKEPFPLHE